MASAAAGTADPGSKHKTRAADRTAVPAPEGSDAPLTTGSDRSQAVPAVHPGGAADGPARREKSSARKTVAKKAAPAKKSAAR